jgi:ABC-type glycerol-3-phosphate transport system permease component
VRAVLPVLARDDHPCPADDPAAGVAALIDGANQWQAFLRIMLPLLRPAVATVAILNSVSIWNDFFFRLIVSPKLPMLQVAVYGLVG